jgi:tripartite-type tricarboxylate transporter receptor subunit TctC
MHQRLLGFCALVAMAASLPTHAQNWPARPIKLIQAASAGTSGDVAARLFGERVQRSLGQAVVVENIAGAAGLIGGQAVARAAPDGYTLLFAGSATVVSANLFFKSVPYDINRDFTAIANLIEVVPFMLAAGTDQPFKSLAEIIALAKTHPGKIAYGIEGSPHRLIGLLIAKRAGVDMVEVRYKAGAQSIQDALSGRTQFMIASMAATEALVKAGKMRRIAVASASRFPGFEDMATVSETLPGVVVDGQYYLMGPAGIPGDIVRRLNREGEAYVHDPEIIKRLLSVGLKMTATAGTPESTAEYLRSERARWERMTKEVGWVPE